ncbi:hypothetical protein CWE09_12865 [Aliidiomarina minuta]|uniref:YgjP-like metallopeptidase domain-containing protein n=1 Tax=Aliidiomarina minuta TaxID=880057 RepID=A0A432W3X7_9GAMM|nr:SprT family zinc-dependent metalloprotease [Aliidiomarina minuta]RUO24031.1 hypothetical protein CWE09_12865 [Aliidiomarina minuta]
MNYTISRSRRRTTIGIKIEQGEVRVMAPTGLASQRIADFVASKHNWIQQHVTAQQARLSPLPKRQWQHGEHLYWLGQKLQLQVRPGQRSTIDYDATTLSLNIRLSRRVTRCEDKVRQLVTQWYKEQAQLWLDTTLPQLAAYQELTPGSWRVSSYRGKWGACSHSGHLSFSWRLFAAPEWVVRYVVHHELCHLAHFDHSKAFWQLLHAHDANLKAAESWLKHHGITLLHDDYFSYVKETE